MGSRTIWQRLVEDLVTVTPNETVLRRLPSCSTFELRQLAYRYEQTAGCRPATNGEDYKTSIVEHFACMTTTKASRLVPGLSCMVMVDADASIHLVSAVDGQSMDVWRSGEDVQLHNAIVSLSLYEDEEIGPTFEIISRTK
jgi:hypothetical protein